MPPTAPLSDFSLNPRALLDEAAQDAAAGAAPASVVDAAAGGAPSFTLSAAAGAAPASVVDAAAGGTPSFTLRAAASPPPFTFDAFVGGADGPPAPWELHPREADLYWPVLRPLPAPPARHHRSGDTQPAGLQTAHNQRPAPFGGPDPRDSVLFGPVRQPPARGRPGAEGHSDASLFVLPTASLPAWTVLPHARSPSGGADLAALSELLPPTLLRWSSTPVSPLQQHEGGTTRPWRQSPPALQAPNDGVVDVRHQGGGRPTTGYPAPRVQRPDEGPWRPLNVWNDSSPPFSPSGPWRGGEHPYVGLGRLRGHLPPRLRTAPPYETLTPTRLTPAQAADAECCLSLEPLAALAQPVAVRAGQAVHLFEYTWLMRHWVRPGQQTNPTNRQPLSTADMLRVLTNGDEEWA